MNTSLRRGPVSSDLNSSLEVAVEDLETKAGSQQGGCVGGTGNKVWLNHLEGGMGEENTSGALQAWAKKFIFILRAMGS